MTSVGVWMYWCFHRYYFFGKTAALWQDSMSEEEKIELAEANKRSWGYGQFYKPTLEISMKKKLYEELGGKFVFFILR